MRETTASDRVAKWDDRMLALAAFFAAWSKDPSTQAGSVIAYPDFQIASVGFNGFPRGVQDSEARLHDRETKLRAIIHAEENGILFAQRPLGGCTIYSWPLEPCAKCAAKIIQVGITRVVAPCITDSHRMERWAADFALAHELYAEKSPVPVELCYRHPSEAYRYTTDLAARIAEFATPAGNP